jgi:glycosyltransferase involved in cell wall biosynthesis
MKIAIYDSITHAQSQRGIYRYFSEVCARFDVTYGDEALLLTARKYAVRQMQQSKLLPTGFRGAGRLNVQRINGLLVDTAIKSAKTALLFSPFYGYSTAAPLQVYTVVDMIHELFPSYFPAQSRSVSRFLSEKKACLMRAEKILAISNSTRNDLLNLYPAISESKVTVTPLGIDLERFYRNTEDTRRWRDRPYLLYVGNRSMYKNFSLFVQAFAQSGLAKDFQLVVISPSQPKFTADEARLLAALGLLNNVVLVPQANEAVLRCAYADAHVFEYEGFGLPILESMACGTIVCTSNVSSMPEVGGDAALYFDPKSVQNMSDTIRLASYLSHSERQIRIQAGYDRARGYSWTSCAAATMGAMESVLARA